MRKNVMEMVIFQTQNGVKEEQFLQLFDELNKVLESSVAGFMKRSLTKDSTQDKWVEMVWWESMEAAQQAMEKLPQVEQFQKYCAHLVEEGMMMFYLEEKA
ncbi:MAG: antibiotic biosynthesis monooxygenase [Erysipelotrichaceae bacterium]|nr:antibiotic biosynthesis monooxygenase [Erysipelotrichaceae bacterium]